MWESNFFSSFGQGRVESTRIDELRLRGTKGETKLPKRPRQRDDKEDEDGNFQGGQKGGGKCQSGKETFKKKPTAMCGMIFSMNDVIMHCDVSHICLWSQHPEKQKSKKKSKKRSVLPSMVAPSFLLRLYDGPGFTHYSAYSTLRIILPGSFHFCTSVTQLQMST